MLEALTKGFRAGRDKLRGATSLSEENIADALRDVRASLLEADVDLGMVRTFLDQVKTRCLGAEVSLRAGKLGSRTSVSAGDHFTKACYEELVALMGTPAPIEPGKRTRVIMLVGLQGTGKTSTAAKLARHLNEQGEKPLLVAADVYRPAAREQLRVLSAQIGVDFFTLDGTDAAAIAEAGLQHARESKCHSVIVDTAGRLQIDDELMVELQTIAARVSPEHTILVCDSMAGREAVNVARGFAEKLRLDGLILSKLDGDSRGGAALAIRQATGVPIRYVAVGEATDRLETFRPEGLASRILGMGDVLSLVEGFEKVADQQKAEEEAKRLLKGTFTLNDFLSQLRTLQKMGPLRDLIEKLPMAGDLFPEGINVDGNELKRIEAMILSMTAEERSYPERINGSRKTRISLGSGTSTAALGEMLTRFESMRAMMAQLGKSSGLLGKLGGLAGKLGGGGGGGGGFPGMGGLGGLGGGQPDLSQMTPDQMRALAQHAPNRAAARAMRAEAKKKAGKSGRDARKDKRKHQRRGKK